MLRLAPTLALLAACAEAAPTTDIGVTLGAGGVRVAPAIGLSLPGARLVLRP